VWNNAAAALLVGLSPPASDGVAVVSRGEPVEIGGAFRIPDIMARSGAKLVEVGATNRTHRKDYEGAIGPATRLLLKVHRSNFQLTGFTADVPPQEIVAVARPARLARLFELGIHPDTDLGAGGPWCSRGV